MRKYTTNKLSDTTLRTAKPKDKLYRLRDGGGLYCEVLTTGARVWRYNYRIHGKQKNYTIGNYPDVGLSDARKKRDEAKEKIKAGIDPSKQKQIEKNAIKENTFYAIAEIWMTEYIAKQSESHQTRTRAFLERDIYTWLGKREATSIEAPEIIQVVKKVAERGAIDAAKRTKGIIQQVFDYAVAHGKATRNPAKDINLQLILPKTTKKHYAAITDPIKLGELLRAIENYQGSTVVKVALRLIPMVMTRPSELTNAEWEEIDFDTSTWTIPAKRRKLLTHTKQANRPEDSHIVPLSDQALSILKDLHVYSSDGKYLLTRHYNTVHL